MNIRPGARLCPKDQPQRIRNPMAYRKISNPLRDEDVLRLVLRTQPRSELLVVQCTLNKASIELIPTNDC